jgi:sigma-B regulation protein RsbU (phosphoserine phosphatase)
VYCSQGHPPAALLRKGKIEELWTPGIAIGAQKSDVITIKESKLLSDDVLFLYTDGVIEAHNLENQLFGQNRLFEALLFFDHFPIDQSIRKLFEEISLFSENTQQHDDIALLAIRIY